LRRLIALALLECACACGGGGGAPPPTEPAGVAVANVDGGSIDTTLAPDTGSAPPPEAPIDAGWITTDYKTGQVEHVGREKALAAMKAGKTHALVRVSKIIEECSSVGGSHVFLEVAFSKELPFRTAHFGGHGTSVVHLKGSLFGDDKQLFIASVETHTPSSFGNGRGWCLEGAPPYDADVLAIVPLRSEGEGMRLLTELGK
jgi:hypothetical protein